MASPQEVGDQQRVQFLTGRVHRLEETVSNQEARLDSLAHAIASMSQTISLLCVAQVDAAEAGAEDDELEEGERPEGQLLDPADAAIYGDQ